MTSLQPSDMATLAASLGLMWAGGFFLGLVIRSGKQLLEKIL